MEYIGIDIGSTCAKVVVLDEDENILHQSVQPTGWSSVDTADIIKNMLLEKRNLSRCRQGCGYRLWKGICTLCR